MIGREPLVKAFTFCIDSKNKKTDKISNISNEKIELVKAFAMRLSERFISENQRSLGAEMQREKCSERVPYSSAKNEYNVIHIFVKTQDFAKAKALGETILRSGIFSERFKKTEKFIDFTEKQKSM